MIIGFDASQSNKTKKTGVEWYSTHLIEHLKNIPLNSGDKFILYTPEPLKNDLKNLPLGWSHKVLNWRGKRGWNQIRLAWELKYHPPDLFFSPGYYPPFFSSIKTGFTVHDLGLFSFPQGTSLGQKLLTRLFLKRALNKASLVIVPSLFTQKELKKFFPLINKSKIKVVAEGCSSCFHPRPKEEANKILQKYQINKPYFLFVGQRKKRKNIVNLIKAYARFRENQTSDLYPELILIGQPGQGQNRIAKMISKTKGVRALGYVKQSDLPYFYNQALAFIFPSLYEGFGLPVLEAMASGCPVLASQSSSIPEVGGNAILYFHPEKIKEIEEKMREVFKKEGLREDLREKGLIQAQKFSWEKCAQETYFYLRQVLKD
jgi:glycosyltransferase involved in cell wall biosynthesis